MYVLDRTLVTFAVYCIGLIAETDLGCSVCVYRKLFLFYIN